MSTPVGHSARPSLTLLATALLAASTALTACGDSDALGVAYCTPLTVIQCQCVGGGDGARVCGSDGLYGECACVDGDTGVADDADVGLDVDTDRGADTGNEVDTDAGSDRTVEGMTPAEAFDATLSGEARDPLFDALIDQVEEAFDEWELEYITTVDWADNAESMLTDPVLHRLVEMIGALHTAKLGDNCEATLLERPRERFQQACLPIQSAFADLRLGGEPYRPAWWGLAAALRATREAREASGVGEEETAEALARCTPPGRHADEELRDSLYVCLDTACVTVTQETSGTHCGDPASLELTLLNGCDYPIAVRYCFYNADDRADCGVTHLEGAEEYSSGAWACNASHGYHVQAMSDEAYYDGDFDFF